MGVCLIVEYVMLMPLPLTHRDPILDVYPVQYSVHLQMHVERLKMNQK